MLHPLITLSATAGVLLLIAGGIITVSLWKEQRAAMHESDEYLEEIINQVAVTWKDSTPTKDGRRLLYLFDKREIVVNRPSQSWALIPYAEELLEAVS